MRIIVGISGASGAIYGLKLLEILRKMSIESHLIISRTARFTLEHEVGLKPEAVMSLAHVTYNVNDMAAACASGSYQTAGMIVAPCSMRSLAEIASGVSSSLLTRAADVVLKERRRLVLMARETPLTLGHLRNMVAVTEMGGIIAPPVPAFYNYPQGLEDIVTHTVGRMLDLFDLDSGMVRRWDGRNEKK